MTELARTPRQIGAIIRRARKKRGWSQSVLGEKTGLRQATLSELESGHRAARLETVLTVLATLDLEFQVGPRQKGPVADMENIF